MRSSWRGTHMNGADAVTDPNGLAECQRAAASLHVASAVEDYVLDIAEATRASAVGDSGISPRATQALLAVAKGYAMIVGRSYVTPDDVQAVAHAVLAHRMQGETMVGLTAARSAVEQMLMSVAVPAV